MGLGNIPHRADVAIGLEKLDRLVEHDDANLTATAQAGMRVASFQEILGQRGQFLPVDPPLPRRATLGGVVAANTNGPRRMMYGGVRDLVIGMKMALATGEQIKAGGKVVKNVAGYDLGKLFVGSLGTLGIITELTFRMAPLPESTASFVASGAQDRCGRFAYELARAQLLPAAVTILSAGAVKAPGHDPSRQAVVIWLEGFEEAIARHLRDLEGLALLTGLTTATRRQQHHQDIWDEINNFGADGQGILYRVTVPIASAIEVLAEMERWGSPAKSLRYVAHLGTGTIWSLLDADRSSVGSFPRLAGLAQSHKGHAVLASGPPGLKEGIDVWGPAPPSLSLMREIKRQFDPQMILNPGRFMAHV